MVCYIVAERTGPQDDPLFKLAMELERIALMDLLKLAKSKCVAFKETESRPGLDAVIYHIEIAEKHYEQGKQLNEYLFTDVIYRTNQAFEGALKEAYRVLAGEVPSSKSPYQIEKHLESNQLLKERVLSQLTNYRTEWRNKSTHDYQLFFSSQEALLAIVSVSAFFNILLDQMLEKHAYELERARLEAFDVELLPNVDNYNSLGFMQQCVQLLTNFSANLFHHENTVVTEYELIGQLAGYLEKADPQIKAISDIPVSHEHRHLQMDILLEKGESKIILEVKRPSGDYKRRIRDGLQQVKGYMSLSGLHEAIVFIPTRSQKEKLSVIDASEVIGDIVNKITLIVPVNR